LPATDKQKPEKPEVPFPLIIEIEKTKQRGKRRESTLQDQPRLYLPEMDLPFERPPEEPARPSRGVAEWRYDEGPRQEKKPDEPERGVWTFQL
jgi:hypothetical protein